MKPLYVESAGLAAPGLPNWRDGRAALAGDAPYVPAELALGQTALLPPNERRRMTGSIRLAFHAAEDALRDTPQSAAELATVFASSDSDLEVLHRINHTLAQPARVISPTDFHNSVHNAAAGYWSIAVGSRRPSTSIAAHDVSFTAALLEAAALVLGDGLSTLLAVYDLRAPPLLAPKRNIRESCAVALVLTPERTAQSIATLEMTLSQDAETALADAALEALRQTNPAARALPLLRLLARREAGTVALPAVESTLTITVRPHG